MNDERLGLPSTSTARRRSQCAGSEALISELRAQNKLAEIPEAPEARSGTRVHAAWAGEKCDLSEAENNSLREILRIEAMLVSDWAGADGSSLLGREERLWLRDRTQPLLSGRYDAAHVSPDGRRVLILDAKTLYGEVEGAQANDQLRELVALFRFNYPLVESFRVAIISPNRSERCSVAEYDTFEAELALRLAKLSLARAAEPDAVRTAGPWCPHCPARLQCPEARRLVLSTVTLAERIQEGQFAVPIGPEGARILDNVNTAVKVLYALKSAYKGIIEADSEAVPGWRLRPGKKIRQIVPDQAFWATINHSGFRDIVMTSCVEVSVSKLEDLLAGKEHPSPKAKRELFDQIFGSFVTIRQQAPELYRER
jgi:uncharacterized protein DUF2800